MNVIARTASRRLGACAILMAGMTLAGGCTENTTFGTLLGAGIGALAGQAIGHNTEGTVIGTAVGAGIGYAIGNEADKAQSAYGGGYGYEYRGDDGGYRGGREDDWDDRYRGHRDDGRYDRCDRCGSYHQHHRRRSGCNG